MAQSTHMEQNTERNLVCVLFPGVVKNDEKALQCLGGIRTISQIYSQPNKKRLGLSYQPDNPFIKKIYADAKKTAGILFKVRVKKSKSSTEKKPEIVSTSVVGRVKMIYKFESMCDFQYLPVDREGPSNNSLECILEKILPCGTDGLNFFLDPAPLFITPPNFTRFDKPINYSYTDKRYPERRFTNVENDDDVHHRRRSERARPVTRYSFNLIDNLPLEPNEFYIKQKEEKITVYPQMEEEYNTIANMFAERPIWSTNMLRYQTKIKLSSLKIILPCVALYIKGGPWRMLWVRYGYDPRKDPAARVYQTLDFRLRHQAGVHSMVMTRDQVVHYKRAGRVRQPPPAPAAEDVPEGAVYFRPGLAPSQRQIFYQYCDILLPEVEEILQKEPPAGYLCHPNRGWMPPNTSEICRDHIFRYVKQTLLAIHSTDIKLEDASSDDDASTSDDDENSTAAEADDPFNT